MGYVVNLVLEGRSAIVVGGGEVASRKIQDLLAAKARVTVVAPRACRRIAALAEQNRILARWRPYRAQDLRDAFMAIAAADDEAVNARVAKDAARLKVLVNVVDRPALCTFTVPATVRRGDLTFAVATEGRCPALAGVLREELQTRYGPEYAGLVRLFGELRLQMVALRWNGKRIRETLSGLYRDGVTERVAAGERRLLIEFLSARLGSAFPLPPLSSSRS